MNFLASVYDNSVNSPENVKDNEKGFYRLSFVYRNENKNLEINYYYIYFQIINVLI